MGQDPDLAPWRGGRVVECTALEMRHRCKPIGGSNPSLSAISTPQLSPVSDCSNLPQGDRRIPRFCANSSRKLYLLAVGSEEGFCEGDQGSHCPRCVWPYVFRGARSGQRVRQLPELLEASVR